MEHFDQISYSAFNRQRHTFKLERYIDLYFLFHINRQEIRVYRFAGYWVNLHFVNEYVRITFWHGNCYSRKFTRFPPDFFEFNNGSGNRSGVLAQAVKNCRDIPSFSKRV